MKGRRDWNKLMNQLPLSEVNDLISTTKGGRGKVEPGRDTVECILPLADKMKSLIFIGILALAASASGMPAKAQKNMEMEFEELLDMVPYEQMVNLGMEYAMSDSQVKSFMYYISSDKFRDNLIQLELTPQFVELAELLKKHKIDLYALTNKVHSALGLPPIRHDSNIEYEAPKRDDFSKERASSEEAVPQKRRPKKRSPGEGVTGLVCEAAEMAPLAEMKEAYKYKVNHNPEFKSFMETLLNIDGKQYLAPIVKSREFQETVKDLKDLGIPLDKLEEVISSQVHQFFDLSANSTKSVDTTVSTTEIATSARSEEATTIGKRGEDSDSDSSE
ncbi:Insect allergen related repeat, nitrile-specifier detoxification [Nesidiocoris tenuis]|uniref:Insect allergen related repeat, nitrile-specifier detoxification n=1 Tax=Nesidiocoris tenuis TaxID=355587 RepID=A0ABN7B3D7_9HEMI|nr:Insect allergen related repeat, nitrile-specifier detoxification [Nesidiocoris tenuis]